MRVAHLPGARRPKPLDVAELPVGVLAIEPDGDERLGRAFADLDQRARVEHAHLQRDRISPRKVCHRERVRNGEAEAVRLATWSSVAPPSVVR